MSVRVTSAEYYVTELEMRMPFHFGDVAVTEMPHVFLGLDVEFESGVQQGTSMGGMVPMWFYKDAEMTLAEGLANTAEVFQAAGERAVGREAVTVFEFWTDLYEAQQQWASETEHPPLLWGYGVSMVEQALLDAACRHRNVRFGEAVRKNLLGLDLGWFYDELSEYEPADLLPEQSHDSTAVRHTVGQTDPLGDDDVPPAERLNDGLPQSLSEYIREDGVTHFKIKLSADEETDRRRLTTIHETVDGLGLSEYSFTVDANEAYGSAQEFKEQWQALADDPTVGQFLVDLLYVEQPLARDDAFTEETREVLAGWEERPPVIIDESDDRPDSAGTALEYGYDGTSHKNCKGVFKGIANACLIERRNRSEDDEYVLSAEDLTTVGPIELLADLAVVATIGADHVERNGHHYFRGLSAFPERLQEQLLDAHGDLYRRHEDGFATLAVEDGRLDLDSVVEAPFGVDPEFDITQFSPLASWVEEL